MQLFNTTPGAGTTQAKTPGSAVTDGLTSAARFGKYGEEMTMIMHAKQFGCIDEGSIRLAMNPTISTGVALTGATQTAWVATTPSFLLYNGGANRIYMDYIKLLVVAAGTAESALHCAVLVDSGSRYSSGGSALSIASPSLDNAITSGGVGYYGAITATSATAAVRTIGRDVFRAALPVVNDVYVANFGAADMSYSQSALQGTAVIKQVNNFPTAMIGPGQSFLFYLWGASMSAAPTFEFEFVYIER
jgi:hypothetical protein